MLWQTSQPRNPQIQFNESVVIMGCFFDPHSGSSKRVGIAALHGEKKILPL